MRIFLSGYGKMGRMIEELALEKEMQIVGRASIECPEVYDSAPHADVCMDFSGVGAQEALCAYIRRTKTPLLSGTTGLTPVEMERLRALSAEVPVIWAANYSTGVAVLKRLLQLCAPVLSDWDKELVEIHHNRKADAPSGTAKQLQELLDPQGQATVVHGREGLCGARKPEELGVFSLRGGTVAGEHTVYFFGEDETLELTHRAQSRRVFAAGALRAAQALAEKKAGWYSLEELIF